jgi:hypothetical protein
MLHSNSLTQWRKFSNLYTNECINISLPPFRYKFAGLIGIKNPNTIYRGYFLLLDRSAPTHLSDQLAAIVPSFAADRGGVTVDEGSYATNDRNDNGV